MAFRSVVSVLVSFVRSFSTNSRPAWRAGRLRRPPAAGKLRILGSTPVRAYEHGSQSKAVDGCIRQLVRQPDFVMFMVAGRLAVGSGRPERGLDVGGATTTSATGAANH
jgi:hypothetical protein